MMVLTKDEFRERMIRKMERRKEGRRQANALRSDSWNKTREHAYSARHANQSAY